MSALVPVQGLKKPFPTSKKTKSETALGIKKNKK
jgi:hypothetical protein